MTYCEHDRKYNKRNVQRQYTAFKEKHRWQNRQRQRLCHAVSLAEYYPAAAVECKHNYAEYKVQRLCAVIYITERHKRELNEHKYETAEATYLLTCFDKLVVIFIRKAVLVCRRIDYIRYQQDNDKYKSCEIKPIHLAVLLRNAEAENFDICHLILAALCNRLHADLMRSLRTGICKSCNGIVPAVVCTCGYSRILLAVNGEFK